MSKVELVSLWAILVWSSCFYSQFGRAQIDEITDPSEVKALKVIKSNLIDPMGKLNSWNNDDDPCTSNWTGVICYNSSVNDGYLHVLELQLLKMNLSGTLAPEFGLLPYMKILDVMWNQINGTIPKEIGNIKSLELLLLNGNQLTGPLPEELGYLPNLDRIQIDQNQISGTLPKSFANLNKTKHFHMNNNSISGEIPSELSRLPSLVHFLLDNNNLSGSLPQDFSKLPKLLILQLDNNKLNGTIPASYGNMTKLLKLSLRNCNLQGPVPDFSGLPKLGYLDLSGNQLTGPIPTNKLSNNITTIDLSDNNLTGPIPSNFSGLPNLQRLSLDNNNLSGSVPSSIWKNMSFTGNKSLILDFQNNSLTSISAALQPPQNVTILLYGNPVCAKANQLNIAQFCQQNISEVPGAAKISKVSCGSCPTDLDYEYNPLSPLSCFCSVPLKVQYRLKSPGFSNFLPYEDDFQGYLTSGLKIAFDQLDIDSFIWEEGPRLKMNLKLFPDRTNLFNQSEVQRIKSDFTGWLIPDSDLFGPYELLNFVLGSYASAPSLSSSGLSKGALIGIIFGVIAGAATVTAVITILFMRRHSRYSAVSRKRSSSKFPIKIDGTKDFTFEEMSLATNDFNSSALVGQGGYGKVYKGILADGTVVAIKRATEGSLQGSKEFCTEIELLSRLHHRNLVSLVGYCDEEDEQMLVYEFMPNGTLRDHLSQRGEEVKK